MKRFLFFASALTLLAACNQEELDNANAENAKLTAQKDSIDDILTQALGSFADIQNNLAAIKEREGIISLTAEENVEFQKTQEEQIMDDIQLINELMLQNKEKMADLDKKLKWAWAASEKNEKELEKKIAIIKQLEETIKGLQGQIALQEGEIASLKEELAAKDEEIAQQMAVISQQTGVISDQDAALNTAYYAYGSTKELKEQGIITKEGGLFGVGGAKKFGSDFNADYFKQIDIREATEIALNVKKAKLISTHPAGTYELVENDEGIEKLMITDIDQFWSASKYLVIDVTPL